MLKWQLTGCMIGNFNYFGEKQNISTSAIAMIRQTIIAHIQRKNSRFPGENPHWVGNSAINPFDLTELITHKYDVNKDYG